MRPHEDIVGVNPARRPVPVGGGGLCAIWGCSTIQKDERCRSLQEMSKTFHECLLQAIHPFDHLTVG